MPSISRRSVLNAITLAALLATVPGALYTVIQTRDLYLFTHQFFQDIAARLSGPGRLRFFIQPLMAAALGFRDGRADARKEAVPFLWALACRHASRSELFRGALNSIRDVVAIAVLLDLIAQYLIFHNVRPGAALLVGPVLIAVPYTISRTITHLIARRFQLHGATRNRKAQA